MASIPTTLRLGTLKAVLLSSESGNAHSADCSAKNANVHPEDDAGASLIRAAATEPWSNAKARKNDCAPEGHFALLDRGETGMG
jgi:hypothetical protein